MPSRSGSSRRARRAEPRPTGPPHRVPSSLIRRVLGVLALAVVAGTPARAYEAELGPVKLDLTLSGRMRLVAPGFDPLVTMVGFAGLLVVKSAAYRKRW